MKARNCFEAWIKEMGLTNRLAAQALGVTERMVAYYKAGKYQPAQDVLKTMERMRNERVIVGKWDEA